MCVDELGWLPTDYSNLSTNATLDMLAPLALLKWALLACFLPSCTNFGGLNNDKGKQTAWRQRTTTRKAQGAKDDVDAASSGRNVDSSWSRS